MEAFRQYLKEHTTVDGADTDRILVAAVRKTLRRNEFHLREGEVCRYKTFICKGLLRIFGTKEDGSEHILYFSPENTWTLDAESYDRQLSARYNITAIENSEVLCWTKPDFDNLLATIPQLKSLSEQIISTNVYNSRQRLLSALSGTPEEKYNEFVEANPGLLARLPLHMIAAYLGISLKTLTRIRQAQTKR